MGEPTMKDVLDAITRLEQGQARTDAKVEAVRGELAAKVDAHRAETQAHRLETAKGFADLDVELADHSDPVHRKVEEAIAELRKDVDALKRRPARPAARRR